MRIIVHLVKPTCWNYCICHFSGVHIDFRVVFWLQKVFQILLWIFRAVCLHSIDKSFWCRCRFWTWSCWRSIRKIVVSKLLLISRLTFFWKKNGKEYFGTMIVEEICNTFAYNFHCILSMIDFCLDYNLYCYNKLLRDREVDSELKQKMRHGEYRFVYIDWFFETKLSSQDNKNVVHLDESGFHLLSSIQQIVFLAIPMQKVNFLLFSLFSRCFRKQLEITWSDF